MQMYRDCTCTKNTQIHTRARHTQFMSYVYVCLYCLMSHAPLYTFGAFLLSFGRQESDSWLGKKIGQRLLLRILSSICLLFIPPMAKTKDSNQNLRVGQDGGRSTTQWRSWSGNCQRRQSPGGRCGSPRWEAT